MENRRIDKVKPNKEKVANRLKLIRKDLGWTIEMMANHLGLSKGTFNSYLRGLAIPPEKVVEQISQFTDVTKEWIYYGDNKDFIEDYLITEGYKEFLKDYPNTVDKINLEYEKQRIKYSLNENYPHERTIDDLFYDIYHPVFKEYINDIASKFAIELQKYPLYSDNLERNSEKYLSRVRMLIHKEKPSIKYGEIERIYKIAETEFNTRVELYTDKTIENEIKNNDFVDFMIVNLKTTKGVLEIISSIVSQKGLDYDLNSEESDKIIEIFKALQTKFVEVKETRK